MVATTFEAILLKYWGYNKFRPLQQEIIESVITDKNDTLALLPTGGGKSIIFQVAAMALPGICVVVTPLISLMKDQVENLSKKGIKALSVYSGMTKSEIDITLDNAVNGNFKFLYLSPERLGSDIFLARLPHMKINLLAIDEAHCISQWGYDFRPAYLKIAEIRKQLPYIQVLALTATATPLVVKDIMQKLEFRKENVFQKSFERKNINYLVRKTDDKLNHLLKIVNNVPGSAVVYVRSRVRTKEIADFLMKNKVSADYYHAGIEFLAKEEKQADWKTGKIRIIVATNAFGMGIDKPDVRFVVHLDLPDSLEAYFQEAGRGGRDEKIAYALLLYNEADTDKLKGFVNSSFPEKKTILAVYNALCNFYQIPVGGGKGLVFDFNLKEFSSHYNFSMLEILNSVKIISDHSYLELTEDLYNPSKVMFIASRDDLYKFQVANSKFDGFIKMMLRTYSGMFNDYVKIDEDLLARSANTSRKVVCDYLIKLSQSKIIQYIPRRQTPLIIMTEERIDSSNFLIKKEYYEDRKKKYETQIQHVIRYVEHKSKCRSLILLEYFGDVSAEACGQCDICRDLKSKGIEQSTFDDISKRIKNLLKKSTLSIEDLLKKLPDEEEHLLSVIQWLRDENLLKLKNDNTLEWLENSKPS